MVSLWIVVGALLTGSPGDAVDIPGPIKKFAADVVSDAIIKTGSRIAKEFMRTPTKSPSAGTTPQTCEEPTNYVCIGNPGVGKSTILNSMMGDVRFKSGISIGSGKTFELQVEKAGVHTYIDTPGLSDIERRREAAGAIKEALQKDGRYKVFFVFTLESGRVRPDDVASMRLVLEAAQEITGYAIIINKVSDKLQRELREPEHMSALLDKIYANSTVPRTDFVHVNKLNVALLDESDVLADLPPDLEGFIRSIPLVHITSRKVQTIRYSEFDKLKEEYQRTLARMESKLNDAQRESQLSRALSVLDKHLLHNTYMVGHTITLADISLCCALLDGMKLVLDEGFRRPYGNLMRWFNTCTQQPEFASVIGTVALCGGGAKAPAPKQNEKKKEEPAGGKKKEPEPKKAAKGQADSAPKDAPKEAAPKKEGKKKGGGDKAPEKAAPDKAAAAAQPAAEDPEKARKDKLKKVIKEGGKRGVEIEGAADMGGLQFFCTSMDLPEGDLELLKESMKAMNAESDPTEEERKGGSGHIGKMIFSAGAEQLAIVAYVPEAKQGDLSCEEWLREVLGQFGGEVVGTAKAECTGLVKTDADKGVFPLKIREPMIIAANNFLRKKGLFPDDDDDDDDEMVFGDDDFPS